MLSVILFLKEKLVILHMGQDDFWIVKKTRIIRVIVWQKYINIVFISSDSRVDIIWYIKNELNSAWIFDEPSKHFFFSKRATSLGLYIQYNQILNTHCITIMNVGIDTII